MSLIFPSALRMVLSYDVAGFLDEPRKVRDPKAPHRCQVLAIDISRAYFNAVTLDDEPTASNYLLKLGLPLVLVRSSRYTCTGRNAPPMDGKASIPGHRVAWDLLRRRRRHACSQRATASLLDTRATTLSCRALANCAIWNATPYGCSRGFVGASPAC